MHRLRHKAETQVGRLLRVLFLRFGAMSTDSGSARRRARRRAVLCLVGNEQPDDGHLARLAQRRALHSACLVDSACRNHCGTVRSRIAANGRLGHSSRLDGCGVHAECATLQSHALPLHWALLSCDDRARDGARYWVRHRRHTWMGLLRRNRPRRKRAYMVGYRAGMGEVLLGRKQLTAARRLRVNRVILTVVRPLTSGLPRSKDILWLSRKVGFVPRAAIMFLEFRRIAQLGGRLNTSG
jgi:hypothetical protein